MCPEWTTRAPILASSRVVTKPSPLFAPVMRTTFPRMASGLRPGGARDRRAARARVALASGIEGLVPSRIQLPNQQPGTHDHHRYEKTQDEPCDPAGSAQEMLAYAAAYVGDGVVDRFGGQQPRQSNRDPHSVADQRDRDECDDGSTHVADHDLHRSAIRDWEAVVLRGEDL